MQLDLRLHPPRLSVWVPPRSAEDTHANLSPVLRPTYHDDDDDHHHHHHTLSYGRYCGPWSWFLSCGCFPLNSCPCIVAWCPLDYRTVSSSNVEAADVPEERYVLRLRFLHCA